MDSSDTTSSQDANPQPLSLVIQKWGGLASFLGAVTFLVAQWLYLVGNLRDAIGPFSYDIADFLYGPVLAASLVMVVHALRERIGDAAPRRMNLALLVALLAAAAFVAVAMIRSANRHYHIVHPELRLEESIPVLVVWTTLITGLAGTGWHFLGWMQLLTGSACWTSRRLPRLLSGLYMVAGANSLFVYLLPVLEGIGVILFVITSIWQGIILWKTGSGSRLEH